MAKLHAARAERRETETWRRQARAGGWGMALVVALVVAAPYVLSPYYLSVVTLGLIYAFPVLGLTLFMGTAGQLSFGHGAIFGVGAYTAALLMTREGVAFPVAFVAAGLSAGLVSAILGMLVLRRVRGLYLAPATFAFNSIVVTVLVNWEGLSGGPTGVIGVPPAAVLGMTFTDPVAFYTLLAVLLAAVYGVLRLLVNSTFGDTLKSISGNEDVAASLGVNTYGHKVRALAVSGAIAGLGGCLFASYSSFINPTTFEFDLSTLFVLMVVVGGLGSLPGAIGGAVAVTVLLEVLRPLEDFRLVVAGVALVVVLIYTPAGMGSLARRAADRALAALRPRGAGRAGEGARP